MNKKRSEKAGLPPGSLVYVGDKRDPGTTIKICRYNEASADEQVLDTLSETSNLSCMPNQVTWIDINGIQDIGVIERIGRTYNLHPLVLEDIINTTKRPKLEDFESHLFIILKVIHYNEAQSEFVAEQVSLVIGKGFVLSFQERDEFDVFESVRTRLHSGKGRLRKCGADYLGYALLDTIVDGYFAALEALGEKLQELEHAALEHTNKETLACIHDAKRQTMLLRRAVWPVREITGGIIREDCDLITKPTMVFLRDVYDHVVEVIDVLEADRDLAAGLMEIYLSGLSNRMNSVMMVLTMLATIFMPLTFIAGVYGMNFKHMPELEWQYGYPMVMILMGLIALGMLAYFRKRGWF